jgi:hypothetical protein
MDKYAGEDIRAHIMIRSDGGSTILFNKGVGVTDVIGGRECAVKNLEQCLKAMDMKGYVLVPILPDQCKGYDTSSGVDVGMKIAGQTKKKDLCVK